MKFFSVNMSRFFKLSLYLIIAIITFGCNQDHYTETVQNRYLETVQKYMVENIDDPSKYEFVSLSKPDTIFDFQDYMEINGPSDGDSTTYEPEIERDSTKYFRLYLKFRYSIDKEKYLFGKTFYLKSPDKIYRVEEKERLTNF